MALLGERLHQHAHRAFVVLPGAEHAELRREAFKALMAKVVSGTSGK